jgi:hypothetical protein
MPVVCENDPSYGKKGTGFDFAINAAKFYSAVR